MLALDVRHPQRADTFELGIVIALTAALAAFAAPSGKPPTATMPAPSPEPVRIRHTATAAVKCDAPGISTIVFRGTVHSLPDDQMATFHFRFADLPDRYSVMTGSNGDFEVRVPRAELGVADLCDLPSSGRRAASFKDASLAISYELTFER